MIIVSVFTNTLIRHSSANQITRRVVLRERERQDDHAGDRREQREPRSRQQRGADDLRRVGG